MRGGRRWRRLSVGCSGGVAVARGIPRGRLSCRRSGTCGDRVRGSDKPILPHGQITAAQTITGGTFNTAPGCATGNTGCATNTRLPQFCRVAGTATPTNDSVINFEVWIPTESSFNGKYEQLGCGGFCGSITYSGLANAVRRGYAAAATDDGSQAGGRAADLRSGPPREDN